VRTKTLTKTPPQEHHNKP